MSASLIGLAAVGALLTGCSSSGDSSTPSGTGSSSVAPESITTTAAAVETGLKAIDALGAKIKTAAATDSAQAKKLAEGIEPLWQPIEGTVKKNDQDAYLTFEDAFAELESGDSAKSEHGASSVSSAVSAYLAKYPG